MTSSDSEATGGPVELPPPKGAPTAAAAPVLFDQRASVRHGRLPLLIVTLVAASVLGGTAAVLATRTNDDVNDEGGGAVVTSAPGPALTLPPIATTAIATSTSSSTTTTAPPTTIPATGVPSNPFGVPLGQPVDRGSPVSEERYAAWYGVTADNAASNTPAEVYARWLQAMKVSAGGGVSSVEGYTLSGADGSVIELRNFELAAGKVSNLSVCAGPVGAAPLCRRLGDAITFAATNEAVVATSTLTATRWATFAVGPMRKAAMFRMTSSKAISGVLVTGAERVDVAAGVMVVTGPPEMSAVEVLIAYTDGTQDLAAFGV
jgi:hypothetical protein